MCSANASLLIVSGNDKDAGANLFIEVGVPDQGLLGVTGL